MRRSPLRSLRRELRRRLARRNVSYQRESPKATLSRLKTSRRLLLRPGGVEGLRLGGESPHAGDLSGPQLMNPEGTCVERSPTALALPAHRDHPQDGIVPRIRELARLLDEFRPTSPESVGRSRALRPCCVDSVIGSSGKSSMTQSSVKYSSTASTPWLATIPRHGERVRPSHPPHCRLGTRT